MKTILTILCFTFGLLQLAQAATDTPVIVTRQMAKEMGINKQTLNQIEELNETRTRDIRVAGIVYRNHPIMRETRITEANQTYAEALKTMLAPEQLESILNNN